MSGPVVEAVAGGTVVTETCPGFEHERTRAELVALTPAGTIVIGELVTCETCQDGGSYFACAACDELVAFDGIRIQRHVATHGEPLHG